VGEDGGIPAGCQCDKEGNIYVADMRLGILKISKTGECKQVFFLVTFYLLYLFIIFSSESVVYL
jgi:hypothetical protein